jgi:hypothetical protein
MKPKIRQGDVRGQDTLGIVEVKSRHSGSANTGRRIETPTGRGSEFQGQRAASGRRYFDANALKNVGMRSSNGPSIHNTAARWFPSRRSAIHVSRLQGVLGLARVEVLLHALPQNSPRGDFRGSSPLESSMTADRSGGVIGIGRSWDLLGPALSPSGRTSRPEPAMPEDVCWPYRRSRRRQQASPAVGPPAGVLHVPSKVVMKSRMVGPRSTFVRNSRWPSRAQLSFEPTLKVLIRRHHHSKVLVQQAY